MNITDSIVDKILYKEFAPHTSNNYGGQYFSLYGKNIQKLPNLQETTFLECMTKVGGSLIFSVTTLNNSSVNFSGELTITLYVDDEIVFSETKNIAHGSTASISLQTFEVNPFSRIKATAKANGGVMNISTSLIQGALIDKIDMYITEVIE